MKSTIAGSILLFLVGAALPAEPKFHIETRKSLDQVDTKTTEDRTLFVIVSESGIGAATVLQRQGDWPDHMTFRFQYSDKKGFDRLEGLVFKPAPKTFKKVQRDGAIEVDLPKGFLVTDDPEKKTKKLTVVWTDEYREISGQGWLVMLFSVGSVIALISFCLYRVLTLPPVEDEHLKGPLEIDTGDTENGD